MGRDKSTAQARRLAQRAHVDQAFAAQAKMRQAAAALSAEQAKAMGVVHDQPGVKALGQRQQRRQVGQIAVHAEDRIGHDQFDRRGAAFKLTRQHREIAVCIALHGRLGEQRTVNQRRMVELVGKDRGAGVAQGGEQSHIRQEAGAEIQRRGIGNAGCQPGSHIVFEPGMGA